MRYVIIILLAVVAMACKKEEANNFVSKTQNTRDNITFGAGEFIYLKEDLMIENLGNSRFYAVGQEYFESEKFTVSQPGTVKIISNIVYEFQHGIKITINKNGTPVAGNAILPRRGQQINTLVIGIVEAKPNDVITTTIYFERSPDSLILYRELNYQKTFLYYEQNPG